MDKSRAGKISVAVGIKSLTGARSILPLDLRTVLCADLDALGSESLRQGRPKLKRLRNGDCEHLERPRAQVPGRRTELLLARGDSRLPGEERALEPPREHPGTPIAVQRQRGIE